MRFGLLEVIEHAGLTNDKKSLFKVKCVCGNTNIVRAANLVKKVRPVVSCGCQKGNRVYGPIPLPGMWHRHLSSERLAWKSMLARCNNKKLKQYKDWGGRGIKCLFESFEDFLNEVGERSTKYHSLGRINNDGNYEHGNVRWESKKEQQNNMRGNRILEYKGRSQTITQWAEELNLNRTYISHRLARGWSVEESIEIPIKPRK